MNRLAALAGVLAMSLAQSATALTEDQAYQLGTEAYVYGIPLIEMARTRHRMTADPQNPSAFGLNTLVNVFRLAGPNSRGVVAPNVDTLYSVAWLDLRGEPVLLDVPDMAGRYYSFQFMDFFTNSFDYVGRRKTGTAEGRFVIVGPNFKGDLPAGAKIIRSPTPSVWLLGRTLIDGESDLVRLRPLMERYKLTTTGAPMTAPTLPQVDPAEPLSAFAVINAALGENPPPAEDAALLARVAAIGVGPGQVFDPKTVEPAVAEALRRAIRDADRQYGTMTARQGVTVDGWVRPAAELGLYGQNFRLRAVVAKTGLAANTLDESFYFSATADASDQPLSGAHRYVLRFEAADIPPVNAFWSVTLYGPDRFLIANPIKRYAIGDRTSGLKKGSDGAIEIYIQHEAPGGDKDANWLPAPAGSFALTLRAYEPKQAIMDGRYAPPPVHRAE